MNYIPDQEKTKKHHDNMIAAIDLGTYGCRMLVGLPPGYQDSVQDQCRIVSRFSQTVKLNVSASGVLSTLAKERLMKSLMQCYNLICKYHVRRYRCVGTAACRALKNPESFIKEVKENTGINLEIISPREEIELACIGAVSVFSPKKLKFIFDIGGGSTEIGVFIHDNSSFPKCIACSSLPYGILTLNPMATIDVKDAFTRHVYDVATSMLAQCKTYDTYAEMQVITTSGPLATIVTLDSGLRGYHGPHIHGFSISRHDILHWIDKIERMGSEEFSKTYNISSAMVSGLPILRGIVEAVKAPVYISNTGVRDGIMKCIIADSLRYYPNNKASQGKRNNHKEYAKSNLQRSR
jgi:exopolyphosphatase/guanosine-5'-triphosphate,3'-diphosphate pyrophosphatase